jgi:hypothetical protein
MKSVLWMPGVMIVCALISGCAEKPATTAPATTDPAPPPSAAPQPPSTPAPAPSTPTSAADPAKADESDPPPPRPEELARSPKGDPGWPKPGDAVLHSGRTPGGVLVEDYAIGTGMPVLPGAEVTIHFMGRVKDGERFQSTYAEGKPQTHETRHFLPGIQEGLVGMRKGGKRRMHIPAALGFGDKRIANDKDEVVIPANSDLVFDVELVDMTLILRDGPPAKPALTPSPAPAPIPAKP